MKGVGGIVVWEMFFLVLLASCVTLGKLVDRSSIPFFAFLAFTSPAPKLLFFFQAHFPKRNKVGACLCVCVRVYTLAWVCTCDVFELLHEG